MNFMNGYLGGAKTEKIKNLRFTGCRVEESTRSQRKRANVNSLCP